MPSLPSIAVMIEQELGKTLKITPGTGAGQPGRYEVNVDKVSLLVDANGVISTAYSTVFLDSTPATATIFSAHVSPLVHDSSLKDKPFKIYRTPQGAAYVYDIEPSTGVGHYYQISQASIVSWRANNQTNNIILPAVPTDNRIALQINGVGYTEDYYTLVGNSLTWHGPFDIEVADIVTVLFY